MSTEPVQLSAPRDDLSGLSEALRAAWSQHDPVEDDCEQTLVCSNPEHLAPAVERILTDRRAAEDQRVAAALAEAVSAFEQLADIGLRRGVMQDDRGVEVVNLSFAQGEIRATIATALGLTPDTEVDDT